jgi:hypothetical protein
MNFWVSCIWLSVCERFFLQSVCFSVSFYPACICFLLSISLFLLGYTFSLSEVPHVMSVRAKVRIHVFLHTFCRLGNQGIVYPENIAMTKNRKYLFCHTHATGESTSGHYSRVPAHRNHDFWPSQRVSKHIDEVRNPACQHCFYKSSRNCHPSQREVAVSINHQ